MAAHPIRAAAQGVMLTLAAAGVAGAQGAASSLGEVDFETSCPAASRPAFNRAVALLHHMTYSGARAGFAAVAAAHPTCAMAHWGMAMTRFQPLWPTRPGESDLRLGLADVRAAERLGGTARERMFVAAAAAFFEPTATDYWDRIRNWAAASRRVAEAWPDDAEAKAFAALAHLAVAPVAEDAGHGATAVTLLETILRDHPRHPGAIHYTIHANDAAGRERESLDVVRSYGAVAPRNPHALHMPTHIFVRLGEWTAVIDGNRLAADAALENPAGDSLQWVWDEFPHAIEYLVYGLLQVGDDGAALDELTRLRGTADLQPGFKTAFHLASIPARHALERRDWAGAAVLDPLPGIDDWSRFPWPEAVTWFARGIGAARTGDVSAARAAETRLGELRDASRAMNEELFALQTEILRLGVAGWLANTDGDPETAVRLLEEAVALERTTPKHAVTPAPTIPAGELLGDLLLELGRAQAALQAYTTSLESTPGRFNGIAGAARAARALNDDARAAIGYRALRALAVAHSARAEVAEAVAFLSRQGR